MKNSTRASFGHFANDIKNISMLLIGRFQNNAKTQHAHAHYENK